MIHEDQSLKAFECVKNARFCSYNVYFNVIFDMFLNCGQQLECICIVDVRDKKVAI